jgi:hypothetical protein
MGRTRYSERGRPRSVWIALGVGVGATVLVALLVLAPVVSLLAGVLGAERFVEVPVVGIGAVVVAGYLLAAGLLALIIRVRHGAIAWVLAVAAVIAATIVSLYPVLGVAAALTDRVGDIVPLVIRWIEGWN